MPKRVGQKIKMTSVDELLGVPSVAGCDEIEVSKIRAFKNHPFKVIDDDKMHELVESIMMNGVLVPVTVRPVEDGNYEMISGHRRLYAVKEIGLERIPAIVKEYDDDEATLAMVDSNLQREEILLSEKAFAYKMKYEAMRKKAGRPGKNNSSQIGRNFQTDIVLADEVGESSNQLHRYLRLTEVIPCILDLVDKKALALVTAVEVSYLDKSVQEMLYEYMMDKQSLLDKQTRLEKLEKQLNSSEEDRNLRIEILNEKISEINDLIGKAADRFQNSYNISRQFPQPF